MTREDLLLIVLMIVCIAVLALCFAYLAMTSGMEGVEYGLICMLLGIVAGAVVGCVINSAYGDC